MSGASPGDAFDARMRRHFAGIDSAPGFESRLAARLAAIGSGTAEALRARAVRRRELESRRLRREAWMNAATAAGVGAAAIAIVRHHGAAVARSVEWLLTAASDSQPLAGIAFAALALGSLPVLRRFLPR